MFSSETKYNALFSQGIWIRQRDDLWQAKISHGGNFINSKFQEVEGRDQILALLKQKKLPLRQDMENLGLSQIAKFTTIRDKWQASRVLAHYSGYEAGDDISAFEYRTGTWIGLFNTFHR